MPTIELRFTALPAHVRTARLLAASMARRSGVSDALVDEIKLAVGEACARAVGLHAVHVPDTDIVVTFSDDDGRYAVTVHDRGPSADGTAQIPNLDELAASLPSANGAALPPGFGLAIIAGLVDELSVTAGNPGTAVRMVWPVERSG